MSNEGRPIYYTTLNTDASYSTRTNHLNTGGSLGLNLEGDDMTVHVWDGGLARSTHQEYDGLGGQNRYSIGGNDGAAALHFHAAHVTGTIMASGVVPNAKGMAPRSNVIGYDWDEDESEAITAASNGMLISNHSYGLRERDLAGNPLLDNYYFGSYTTESKDWDEIMFNAPYYLMVVAAGNSGNDNTVNGSPLNGNSNFDKLTGHTTSKNNLVVANVLANGDLVGAIINLSSSEGPTDDLRIKPDITGNGTLVFSTYESSDNDYSFARISGTSMACPNVSGSLLLLQEHWYNLNANYLKSATLKGLALHTADDLGTSGPDAIYGWGLLNSKKAAETITLKGNKSRIKELTLNSGGTYVFTVDSDGVNPLIASISWTDRPGTATTQLNSTTPVLVNDLDIRVSKSGNTHMPYRLESITTAGTGDNIVDPFERIDVDNASGTYTITISHKGTLTGGSQNYSLIVTGVVDSEVEGEALICNGSSETYTLNSIPSGVTTTWQVSGHLQIISSTNTSVTVKQVSPTANGVGYVKAILGSITSELEVFVGTTEINYTSFYNNAANGTGYLCSSHYGNMYNIADGSPPNTTYQYRLLKHPNLNVVYTSPTGRSSSGEINYTASSGWYTFEARGTNTCGTSDWFGTDVEYVDCNEGGGGGDEGEDGEFVIMPNPVSESFTIVKKNNSQSATFNFETKKVTYELYNFNMSLIKKGNLKESQQIDISSLKKGLYILKIISKTKVETHRIIIE